MKCILVCWISLMIVWVTGSELNAQDQNDPQNMRVEPQNTDCHQLPEKFDNFDQALARIKEGRFNYQQDFKTTRNSGLMEASYYSCDFKKGFLVVKFDGQFHIYPELPLDLWKAFRNTPDIDGFYLNQIKPLEEVAHE